MDNLIVGLDIGTCKVCAVIGEYNENNSLEIIGVGISVSRGIRRGVVINIEATMQSIMEAVEAAEMMSGREVETVFTGIAGGHIEGINSRGVVAVTGKGREITTGDINRVIDAAKAIVIPMDREVLHVIPQEYIVDEQGGIKNPINMIGVRLEAEVHIITSSVTSAQNLIKCVNRAGFRVSDFVLESLASSKAVLKDEEKDLGVLLIDLGGGTTDVLVYLDGAPYFTNVVSIGGDQVSSDLSIILKTPLDSAEKIKKESGCAYLPLVDEDEEVVIPGVGGWPSASIPRAEVCKIIQPRMAEMFSMVKDLIDKKGYSKHLGGGVVLTGGGAQLPGVAELAREIFNIPARVGFPHNFGGLKDEYKSPAYATAVGLVLAGSEAISVSDIDKSAVKKRSDNFMEKLRNWMKEFF